MNKFLLSLSIGVFMCFAGQAQPVLTAANFTLRVGDVSNTQKARQVGVVVGTTGANQIWDYSNLVDTIGTTLSSIVQTSNTPFASYYPTANISEFQISNRGSSKDTTYGYYLQTSASVKVMGSASLNSNRASFATYRHPIAYLRYPFTYMDSTIDSSLYVYETPSIPYKDSFMLILKIKATGYGTLKLPGGKVYNNTLQITTESTTRTASTTSTSKSLAYLVPSIFHSALNTNLNTTGGVSYVSYLKTYTLPLSWLSFTAKNINQQVQLNWVTANEVNTHHFVVQRSCNGNEYEDIKQLPTVATNTNEKSYEWTDEKPIIGVNYYRIKQVDKDGTYSYSEIKTLNFKPSISNIQVYPNPAHSVIHIKVDRLMDAGSIVITDLYGKQLHQQILTIGTNTIDIAGYAKGVYFVSIVTKQGKQTQKVVVE